MKYFSYSCEAIDKISTDKVVHCVVPLRQLSYVDNMVQWQIAITPAWASINDKWNGRCISVDVHNTAVLHLKLLPTHCQGPIDPSAFHTVDVFKSYLNTKASTQHFLISSCYPTGNAVCLACVRSSSVRGCTFIEEEEKYDTIQYDTIGRFTCAQRL